MTTASVVPLVPVWRVDREFDYTVPAELADALMIGSLVRVPFGGRRVRGIVVRLGDDRRDDLEKVAGLVVEPSLVPGPLIELAGWVARRYVAPRNVVLERFVPPRVRVRPPAPAVRLEADLPIARLRAYEGGARLIEALREGSPTLSAVRCLPGEDRAALVAELIASATRGQRGAALVAVPEVHYGSIVLAGLARLLPQVQRVDSGVGDAERAAGWVRMAQGHALAAGGRSTVFAPAPRLSLVVLDDEHHPSYKEERTPRYDARRVAVARAGLQHASCVFLSATPSVELGARIEAGEVTLVEADRAARREGRPIVELVARPHDRALSAELHARIRDALRARSGVGLLVPARGYARALWCAACRRSIRCPRCEAGMAFDRADGRVRCPRCGLMLPAPDACPSCGSHDLRYIGAGSERLAEQLRAAFPRARTIRVDPDVLVRDRPDTASADIYVTTWIGTKEAMRPRVGLVGVLDADQLIRRPHFRSAERAYQAFNEMAEWAGPAGAGGRLVLQTAEPNHHAIQAVARADYWFFLRRELEQRRELGYPPFSELIRMTASGQRAHGVMERAASVANAAGARALGPVPLRGEPGALELLLKCRDAEAVAEGLRDILADAPPGARLRVDVDPL